MIQVVAIIRNVKNPLALTSSLILIFAAPPMVLAQLKLFSMRLWQSWLSLYHSCRVVRRNRPVLLSITHNST
jgi:hypothetical protein